MADKIIGGLLVVEGVNLKHDCERCVFSGDSVPCELEPCYEYNGGSSYFINDEDFEVDSDV